MKQQKPELKVKNRDCRADEASAIEHFHADVGMNFDAGFGDLLGDTGAGDVENVIREHRKIDKD